MVILFLVFLIAGLFMLTLPKYFWMITEQWKSSDATEPSGLFVISTRFGGGVLALLGIMGIVFVR